MNPVEYVIHLFGGVRKLAKAVGKNPSTISKWRKPRNGSVYIPSLVIPIILKKAKQLKLDLNSDDLIYGRKM